MKSIVSKALFLTLTLAGMVALAQHGPDAPEKLIHQKADKFVADELATFKKSPSHLIAFEGYAQLPRDLDQAAQKLFPKHRFRVAQIAIAVDNNAYRPHILIVSDPYTGEVISHLYDLVFSTHTPESFRKLLAVYRPRTRAEAIQMIEVLAKLIGYPERAVGVVTQRKGVIEVPINWGDRPWRILRTKFRRDLRIDRIRFINPVTGQDAG